MAKDHFPEIDRFEIDALLYQVFLYSSGEAHFKVTGDTVRLGILSKEEMNWSRDFEMSAIASTDAVVNLHVQSLRVLRRVALRYGQFIDKHRPFFVCYRLPKDRRVDRICLRLLARHHPQLLQHGYDSMPSEDGTQMLFTRRPAGADPA